MNQSQLLDLIRSLNRIAPVLLAAFVGYLAYDYFYVFEGSPESPKNMKKAEIVDVTAQNDGLKKKIREINEFFQNLEAKKQELRQAAQELDNMKATLTESVDVPGFMNTTTTEAKKVGLSVKKIRPLEQTKQDYYGEQVFDLEFRGVYAQIMVFLNRLARSNRIIRVEQFKMKPVGSQRSRFVELEGSFRIKTYFYVGSKEDTIGRGGA